MLRGLTAVIIILLTLLILTGISYAYWRDKLEIVAVVKTGRWISKIHSYKIVPPPGYGEHSQVTAIIGEDCQCLNVTCVNVSTGWHIWIGILVANDGTVPVKILNPQVLITPRDLSENFTVNTYLYGPYSRGDHIKIWDEVNMEDLPFNGSVETVALNPSQKAVIWIKFTFNGDNEINIEKVWIDIMIRHGVNI